MQRAMGSGLFQGVGKDFLKIVLCGPAEPVARWHSGPPLDSSSQLFHSRCPIGHPVLCDFVKGVVGKFAEVLSGTTQQLLRDPGLFLFAQTLKHPLLKQPAVLRLFQQTQTVTHDFAGGSVAPQGDQSFHEGVLLGW